MGLRDLLTGIVLGVLIAGCASAGFAYKYYGMDAVSYDGTLLGPTAQQDLSLKVCEPDQKDKGKCVVMLRAEFYRLKGDHLTLQKQLIACQQGYR